MYEFSNILQTISLFPPKCVNLQLRRAVPEKSSLLALGYTDSRLPRVNLSFSILSLFHKKLFAYLQINPEIQLTIIDADSTVGGVWSKSCVFAGLNCDIPVPTFEFPNLHVTEEFNLPKWSELPGSTVYQYLERYAKKLDMLRRCIFNTEVIRIESDGKEWKLFTKILDGKATVQREIVTCDVILLLMATRLCSKLSILDVDNSAFGGMVLHSKDLHRCHDNLISEKITNVIVVGSRKSSFQAANTCAMAGKIVYWLAREKGASPSMLFNAKLPNGKSALELTAYRIIDFNVPTIYRYRG
jgi:cation diffusion facilitator CzcD-associated flavoprotein CzcO